MTDTSTKRPYRLFEVVGIEIESMLVDATTFDVSPKADLVLRSAEARRRGSEPERCEWASDFADGRIEWSNELVNHVVEFKTAKPERDLAGLAEAFRASQRRCDAFARTHGARLVPGAMHPWMDPRRETHLWRHDNQEVYSAYDRLFDCKRHGWSNLQSVHLNLPFADDDEFARLMSAVRVVLPLVPALAAGSPFVEGRLTGLVDNRLEVYRTNSAKVGAMTGDVIPEQAFDRDAYRRVVFDAIDAQLLELHADEILFGVEWTNARGAIARFDRMAIEIRLIDAQECAAADVAIAAAVASLVRGLVEERWSTGAAQRAFGGQALLDLLVAATARGRKAVLPPGFAALFGETHATTAAEVLRSCVPQVFRGTSELEEPLRIALEVGTLSERLVAALGPRPAAEPPRLVLARLLERLANCLLEGRSFVP